MHCGNSFGSIVNRKQTRRTGWTFILLSAFSALSFADESLPSLVKKIEPAVVHINTYDQKGNLLVQGSGFFISSKAEIITNRHVLQGAFRAEAKSADGKVHLIKSIVAEDREGDLLKITLDKVPQAVPYLVVIERLPEKGERVVTVGSPLGLEQTLSDGIVSAVRDIPGFGKVIQITAPISSGSSGSPVVNMIGEVVGIATLQKTGGQNLNFAIPGKRIVALKPLRKELSLVAWTEGQTEEWASSEEGLLYIGLSLFLAEDYEKALPYFEKTVRQNSQREDAWFLIGICKEKLGRNQEAIEALKEAIRIKPDFAEAYYSLGVNYVSLGRDQDAIEAFKQGIRIKPELAESPEKALAKAKVDGPGVQNGSTVKMEYTLTDKDGKMLDTNKGQEPLTYTHGEGQIIRGLEKALTGLHVGDQKHVVVPPQEGYGPIRPEAIIEVPKERIPPESQKVGTQLMARNQNGPPIPLLVKEVKEKTIVLDANHPLAGMTLTFDVKIVGVDPAPAK